MDQVKVFLRQCVKHRFWIAVGVSILLPIVAYFLGSGPITAATTKAEGEIKGADSEVKKYNSPGLANDQYAPIIKGKTEILTKDVDATWQKLFAQQEPLLRWPEVVESRFRTWGRKWPENVDRGAVTQALVDYSIAYPEFVTKIYNSFNPWDPLEGTGIVAAPDEAALMHPAPFDPAAPPQLGKVWAEQERLWVLTALLNVVKDVNGKAKDWDGAIVKQINAVEVGSPLAQDQVSIAEGVALEPAVELTPEGEAAPAADAAAGAEGMSGMMPGMAGMMGPGAMGKSDTVMYVKTESTQFTLLPVMMNVLVDQNHLQDFLVGLENSPITIQVLEPELAKPAKPVEKPVYGMTMNFGFSGMGMGMPGMMGMGGMESGMGRGTSGMMMPGMGAGMMGRGMAGMDSGMGMSGMMGMNTGAPKAGKSIRDVDKKAAREKAAKEAKAKPAVKAKALDPYYNVIEVTIYGQARFYNAPPPKPAETPSAGEAPATAEPTPSAIPADSAPAPTAPPATGAAPADAPKADAKTEAPAAETPKADAPKPEAPPADAPKADAPKADAPPADAPKTETPPTTQPPAAPQR